MSELRVNFQQKWIHCCVWDISNRSMRNIFTLLLADADDKAAVFPPDQDAGVQDENYALCSYMVCLCLSLHGTSACQMLEGCVEFKEKPSKWMPWPCPWVCHCVCILWHRRTWLRDYLCRGLWAMITFDFGHSNTAAGCQWTIRISLRYSKRYWQEKISTTNEKNAPHYSKILSETIPMLSDTSQRLWEDFCWSSEETAHILRRQKRSFCERGFAQAPARVSQMCLKTKHTYGKEGRAWWGGEGATRRGERGLRGEDRYVFFSIGFAVFSTQYHLFSTPPPPTNLFSTPPQFFSTYPILLRLVLYAAVTYTLSGCMNVLCNRPIPAQPPMHPARLPSTRVTAAWEGRGCERGLSTARERRHRTVRGASTRAWAGRQHCAGATSSRRERGVSTAREQRHRGLRGASARRRSSVSEAAEARHGWLLRVTAGRGRS